MEALSLYHGECLKKTRIGTDMSVVHRLHNSEHIESKQRECERETNVLK